MVRQVEMPKMNPNELRSALRYEMGDLLPIPVEQAVFDFVELGPGRPKGDGGKPLRSCWWWPNGKLLWSTSTS